MQNSQPTNQNIFKLAWPIAMNAVLMQLILIIDTLLITPLGEESLSAMGLAASIAGLFVGIIFAFSNGTQLIIAQAFGAKSADKIEIGFKAGLATNLIISAIGFILIIFFSPYLIDLIAETKLMARLSLEYLTIFTLVIFGMAGCQSIAVYFNAIGKSKIPFYANLAEVPINVSISIVLIYGWGIFPELGLKGAAIGSAIAVFIRLIFLISFKRHQSKSVKKVYVGSINFLSIKNHLIIATPIAATFISMVLANSVSMMICAKLGVFQFAAITLINPWIKVIGQLSTAWATATGILVGQLLGSKIWDSLDEFVSGARRAALVISIGLSILYLIAFFLFEFIYPDLEDETLQTLWYFMPILVIIPSIRASNTICGHVLRAGGDAVYAFKVHSYTQWLIIIPLTALFVLYFELSAAWVFSLILLEEIIKSVPFHSRLWSGIWKRDLLK